MGSLRSNVLFFIIGAALMWLLLKQCSLISKPPIKYLPGDSVPYAVYEGVPKPYNVYYPLVTHDTIRLPGDTQYVLKPIDTMFILKDYYAKVTYIDTIKNDSSALIVLNEVVTKNRIADRSMMFQNRRPTAIIDERKNGVVLGVGGAMNGIDLSVGYRHKENTFNITYSSLGLGVRYQRDIGWLKSSQK
jgi:hypothetical protein